MTKKDIREWHTCDGVGDLPDELKINRLVQQLLRPLILGIGVGLAIVMWAARASGADGADKTLSPYFSVETSDANAVAFPLRSTDVSVIISGVMAEVTVKQLYANMGSGVIDAVYIFPASTRSAVHGMTMRIGDRTIEAKVLERGEARQEFEKAKSEKKTAALLEQQRPNVFQMNIGRVLPGDEVEIELRYTEHLVPEEGTYEFMYPTVVGPRYSNQRESEAKDSEKWIANPYLKKDIPAPTAFSIAASVNGGVPLTSVACDSHPVKIDYSNETSAQILLDESELNGGNRDFILRYELAGKEVASGLLLHEAAAGAGENFFLLTVQPPARVKNEDVSKREYVFVLDVSGSMEGFPLNTAKQLMANLLKEMRPTDRFNVLLFAGSSEVLSQRPLAATASNLKKANALIDRQGGGGGTELLPALSRAMALEKAEGYSRSIVIVTDGYVQVEREAFDMLRNNLGEANAFAFGIGSSVNRFLIEGIARAGGGESFVVTRPAEAASMAQKLHAHISAPVLTDIEILYNGFEAYDVEPKSKGYPDVMAERPLVVWGKWHGSAGGNIEVTGLRGDGSRYRHVHEVNTGDARTNPALPYLWARNRIATLSDYIGVNKTDEDVREVTNLGISYNLLTEYTSFIAVDTEVGAPENSDVPTLVKQPLTLPQGVSNAAVPEPQTALLALVATFILLCGRSRPSRR
ncbi:MAG: VIT domain-containing protein [Verrucomicrobia bacterium]|nr:VIT domain-containing protein [Verrucomicrobiota bacterium]